MTSVSELPTRQTRPIESVLRRLRRRMWTHVWLEGLVVLALVLALSFWLTLGFDWVFEPPPILRQVILAGVILAGLYVVYRFVVRRLVVRVADKSLALLLERRFKTFGDSLLTTVELHESPEHAEGFNAAMLDSARDQAEREASAADVGAVLNRRLLARRGALAVFLVVSMVVFSLVAGDAFALWARRSLAFSQERWPRRTHLSVEGFTPHAHRKVARGADFDLVVRADAALERIVPDIVEIRYEAEDGAVGRENMSRLGVAVQGRDDFQAYQLALKGLLSSRQFYVQGGDAREGPFFLDVVDSPTLANIALHCDFPDYTARKDAQVTASSSVQLPRGTRVTLTARANKELVEAQIDKSVALGQPQRLQVPIPHGSGQDRRTIEVALGPLDADQTLLFTLLDADGIRNREPIRLTLTALADEAPRVDVRLLGIGTAVTPNARLPAAGQVVDDYGVRSVWFSHAVDEGQHQKTGIQESSKSAAPPLKLSIEPALELEPLGLAPKQKLRLAVQAEDNFSLPGVEQPANIGVSQEYLLDVVTPDQLRTLLEARELTLRRRFEVIIEEFTATRDGIATSPSAEAAAAVPPATPAPDAEGEKKPKPAVLRIERSLQNAERAAHETLELAAAFENIRLELANNRVDTEELKIRIQDGIVDPLQKIGGVSIAELRKRLVTLRDALAAETESNEPRAQAVKQADAILVEMRGVLDKMLELETFNEVLDALRSIIAEQDKINRRTKERQKEKIKELLK